MTAREMWLEEIEATLSRMADLEAMAAKVEAGIPDRHAHGRIQASVKAGGGTIRVDALGKTATAKPRIVRQGSGDGATQALEYVFRTLDQEGAIEVFRMYIDTEGFLTDVVGAQIIRVSNIYLADAIAVAVMRGMLKSQLYARTPNQT